MRIKTSLLAKILGCLALNLLALAAVAAYFGWRQLGPDWIFPNSSRQRVQAMSEVLAGEMHRSTPESWDDILARVSEAYGFRFALYTHDGMHVAGTRQDIPLAVQTAASRLPKPPPHPPGRGPERRPPGGPFPSILVPVQGAERYWLVVEFPLHAMRFPGAPLVLIGSTAGLGSSSLLFNPFPWATGLAIALGLSVLAWIPLVRDITRSIASMTRATESIANGHFDVSLNESRSDELGRLAAAINRMAQKLDIHIRGQKRFLADVAHELCSPLARLEVALGVLEQKAPSDLHPSVIDAREEVREMSALVSELLDFSRAALRSPAATLEPVSLLTIVNEIARRDGGSLDVQTAIQADIQVLASPPLLNRAISNILRNASRHAKGSSQLDVTAQRSGEQVILSIRDHGPGVPSHALPHLFEAFYRPDASRSRESGGAGLGLAIVKTCIDACGGTVTARNHPQGGFEVLITLRSTSDFTNP